MDIRLAAPEDMEVLALLDRHIARAELEGSMDRGRIYIAEESGQIIGWLRYSLFWDNTLFMNMLYLLEGSRGKGYGRRLVAHWEAEMGTMGYHLVMTSTPSNECSQHFYQALGYETVGGFLPKAEPFELILSKELP